MDNQYNPTKLELQQDGKNIWGWFVLYLIWPFGTLMKSFTWIRTKEAMNLFWLFCIYFGFTFVVQEGSRADSTRAITQLQEMRATGISMNELLGSFYASGSGDIDVLESLITFIVSRFTDNYRILFAVYGLIFGYFYSRNIWILINKTNGPITLFPTILLMAFIVVVGIWDINGFRYYTAVQIFMFGTLSFLLEGKKRKLWLAAVAILVHWSFLIAFTVLLVYFLSRNQTKIYFILFVASFFVAALHMDLIRQWFDSYAPAMIRESRSGYLSEGYKEAIDRSYVGANWYLKGHLEIIKWFIFISFSYIQLRGIRKVKENIQLFKLYNFSLLFYAIVNVFSIVPSMGRFYAVANMLCLAFLFLNIMMVQGNYPALLKKLALPAMLIFIIVKFRMGFDFMGSSLLLGNPVTAFFIEHETPLIEFVKSLL
ncbi:MAG: EpsG family protein [Bacteroidales bacterium]|nr:EpsG family protein [Bacteroidales bacterium]